MKTPIKPGDVISMPEAPNMVVTWVDDTEVRAESVMRIEGRLLTKKLVGPTGSIESAIIRLWREDLFGMELYLGNWAWYLIGHKIEGQEKTLAKAIEMAYHALSGIEKEGEG